MTEGLSEAAAAVLSELRAAHTRLGGGDHSVSDAYLLGVVPPAELDIALGELRDAGLAVPAGYKAWRPVEPRLPDDDVF